MDQIIAQRHHSYCLHLNLLFTLINHWPKVNVSLLVLAYNVAELVQRRLSLLYVPTFISRWRSALSGAGMENTAPASALQCSPRREASWSKCRSPLQRLTSCFLFFFKDVAAEWSLPTLSSPSPLSPLTHVQESERERDDECCFGRDAAVCHEHSL